MSASGKKFAGHEESHHRNGNQIETHYRMLEHLEGPRRNKGENQSEMHSREQHKEEDYSFDDFRIIIRDGGIACAEPSCGYGAERMVYCIEKTHPGGP